MIYFLKTNAGEKKSKINKPVQAKSIVKLSLKKQNVKGKCLINKRFVLLRFLC